MSGYLNAASNDAMHPTANSVALMCETYFNPTSRRGGRCRALGVLPFKRMYDRYFACQDCRMYIEAGYRWAYHTLEVPEITGRGLLVDVEAVLAAEEYWRGGEGAEWLNKILPEVARFLATHRPHDIMYGEWEDFLGINHEYMPEWTEVKARR